MADSLTEFQSDAVPTRPMVEAVSILDPLLILARRARSVLLSTAGFVALGVLIGFLLKPKYEATAIILPPQQSQSSASMMLGQLGSLESLANSSSLGLKSPADIYIGMLKSETVARELIADLDLRSVYKLDSIVELQKKLASHSEIEVGKNGLIYIKAVDHSARRASDIANDYIAALSRLNARIAMTEAEQRRKFFEQRVVEERTVLVKAEEDLLAIQQKTGIIQLNGQTAQTILSIADIRSQVQAEERDLQSLRTAETDQNPNVIRSRERLAVLEGQLSQLERGSRRQIPPAETTLTASRLPENSLEYLRESREVAFHDRLYQVLQKQSEAARIDQAKASPLIQVVDYAAIPDKKSGPSRLLLITGCAFIGFVLSCVCALLSQAHSDALHQTQYAKRAQDIAEMLRPRIFYWRH